MAPSVYVSHTDEDIARCEPLLRTLGTWQIPAYFDSTDRRSTNGLAAQSQQALVECDMLLRVCTRFTNRSYWMSIESGAFLSLQADDQRSGTPDRRRIVNLILDPRYAPEPFDVNGVSIDATNTRLGGAWVNDLRRALGLEPISDIVRIADMINPPPKQGMSRRAVVGLGAAGVVALAAGVAGGVALAHRGGGTSSAPRKPPSSDPRLRWWRSVSDPARPPANDIAVVVSGLTADSNAIYVATLQGEFTAFSVAGQKLWQYDLGASAAVYQRPVVSNGIVYVNGDRTGIFAIQNGALLWSKSSDSFSFTTPVVAEGKLWVNAGGLYAFVDALDLTTGANLFGFSVQPFTLPTAGVAVSGALLYCGCEDGYLYAFDVSKSDYPVVWKSPTGAVRDQRENKSGVDGYYVGSLPVVADGIVYAGSTDNNLYAFDAQTGKQRWAFATQDQIIGAAPAVANGIVYVASQDHSLYAVDAATGALRWRYQTRSKTISAPTVANGVVYVTSGDHAVYALDATTGAVRHTYKLAASARSQPAVAGGQLYAADAVGNVYAFTTD